MTWFYITSFAHLKKDRKKPKNKQKTPTNDYLQTFSELRHVVVRWFAQMDEEIWEIATNSNGEHECSTYPKWTLKWDKNQ